MTTTVMTGSRPSGAAGITQAPPLLTLRGISKSFGPVEALTDVDLEVPAGQVTALVGDNGAGKSVLIKCIAGIHHPDRGEMRIDGKPVHLRNPKHAAELGIQTVYQDLALCGNLDIAGNMFLGRERTAHGVLDEDGMESSASATIAGLKVNVSTVRQPVASLSGGQRQCRGRPLGDVAFPFGDHGRADCSPRRGADRHCPRFDPPAGRAGNRGPRHLPQPQ